MPVRIHPLFRDDDQDRRFAVDRPALDRLRASFQTLGADPRFAERFYERLFASYPDVRAMFSTDPARQAEKLVESLRTVVENLENTTAQHAYLSKLGADHAGYGVRPEHYRLVTDLLTESIAQAVGPELAADWHTALELISEQMIRGAESAG